MEPSGTTASTMELRAANTTDIDRITDIVHAAFEGLPDYEWHYPKHRSDPENMKTIIRRQIWSRLNERGYIVIMGEAEQTIVGVAIWEVDMQFQQYFDYKLKMISSQYPTSKLSNHHALHMNQRHTMEYNGVLNPILHKEKDQLSRCWELHKLAVDPKHGGKGYGRKLVEWGMKEADKEGVTLLLEATEQGFGLYTRLQWQLVQGTRCEGDKASPAGITGYVMRYPAQSEVSHPLDWRDTSEEEWSDSDVDESDEE